MAEVMVDEHGRPEPHREGGEVATLLRALWTEGVNRSRAVVQAQLSRGEKVALCETHADRQLPHPVSLRWVEGLD